ncbi:N-acetyltransferase family protein [Listeria ivanovii]|uniref:GNAT family N-acetyltransferase n=1 Tax=Listeria ivanovii TaxID=1638 RepID=UPI0003EC7703|nr:GNAT family N-acetyltransferase [Listeria ivanovii]AHI54862.1 GNAT family acetyltransferase [Listeria ivanovii WSLC3009]AIS64324.1 GNAT family acetyltransferase [Listeria ivanovii subsp. ivanovii]MBC1760298.1 GNAT family N-acetyltransferase [Listeria ivanovii]MBK3915351.1 GNAT family N-acetyltransferase [Listeria ivanovii subsp. ivanovii]MBK3922479.1 GNAT family N-acetyltransferase [Listeria ivanovii subsp. ivanovii]
MKRNYHVKFLTEKDVALAEAVCSASEDYYLIEQDKPASKSDALKIITEIPNGKTRFDKFVMAVLDENEKPIGLVDIVSDYPRKGRWFIGLLLLTPAARGNGLGKVLHQTIQEWANDGGADSLALGVLAENEKACGFFKHLGYTKEETKEATYGEKVHQVDIYTLTI